MIPYDDDGQFIRTLYTGTSTRFPSMYVYIHLKGSQQQGALVHFSLFREKREKHNFWQFSKYVDFSCKNEQDMFENIEIRRFCNDFTA